MNAGPQRPGPLGGIRVIELAGYLSAPLATMMMSDLGADVVKVEPPTGDPFRRVGRARTPVSPMFYNVNRGKRVATLDLKDPRARARLHELLKDADIVVSNWRPSVAERLGLSDSLLAEENPRLIRVYLTGFGTSGPLVDAPVYDAIIQAHVGAAESSPPAILPGYVTDKIVAGMACQATLAALLDRERNGTAQRVDLSLLDAAAYFNFPEMMANRTFVDHAPRLAKNEQAAAVRALQTADGWLIVSAVTAEQIRRTCEVVGRPELADELLSIRDATELTRRMFEALTALVRERSTEYWVKALREKDVAAGSCLTIDEHLEDEQVVNNRTYGTVDREGLGRVREVRYPAVFAEYGELWPRSGALSLPPRPPVLEDSAQ